MSDSTRSTPEDGHQPSSRHPEAATVASDVVAALEAAWAAIQDHHPDLPDTVLVLGTGVSNGRLVKLGHWWGSQWQVGGEARGEVLLAGEALHEPPERVFAILLHEAAHGLAAARRVRDSSRGGRYHNANFRHIATEVGLEVARLEPYGWASTTLPASTRDRYADAITRIGEAVHLARRLPDPRSSGDQDAGSGGSGDTSRRQRGGGKRVTAGCGCGRRIWMAPSTAERGPIHRGLCGEAFLQPQQRDRARDQRLQPAADAQSAASFLDRRLKQLRDPDPETPAEHQSLTYFRSLRGAFEALAQRPDAPEAVRDAVAILQDVDESEIARVEAREADIVELPREGQEPVGRESPPLPPFPGLP